MRLARLIYRDAQRDWEHLSAEDFSVLVDRKEVVECPLWLCSVAPNLVYGRGGFVDRRGNQVRRVWTYPDVAVLFKTSKLAAVGYREVRRVHGRHLRNMKKGSWYSSLETCNEVRVKTMNNYRAHLRRLHPDIPKTLIEAGLNWYILRSRAQRVQEEHQPMAWVIDKLTKQAFKQNPRRVRIKNTVTNMADSWTVAPLIQQHTP